MKTHLPHHLATLAAACALASVSTLKANNFDFTVNLDTAGLVGAANAPFYLDLQLNQGDPGTTPNSVTVSDFTFDGGAATGTPELFGDATGSLGGTVMLDDSAASPFNEFFQGFTDGTTEIHFDVSVSQNSAGATPDEFAAAILDSEPNFPQIPTTSPDGVSLVTLDLGAANTSADVGVYESLSPLVSGSLPDAASTGLLFIGAAAMLMGFRRFGAQGA